MVVCGVMVHRSHNVVYEAVFARYGAHRGAANQTQTQFLVLREIAAVFALVTQILLVQVSEFRFQMNEIEPVL